MPLTWHSEPGWPGYFSAQGRQFRWTCMNTEANRGHAGGIWALMRKRGSEAVATSLGEYDSLEVCQLAAEKREGS
jgi:hypothetical protein